MGKLSPELRNKMYSFVIDGNLPQYTGKKIRLNSDAVTPPIARVCRQMRDECVAMHFAGAEVEIIIYENGRTSYDYNSNACDALSAWLNLVSVACHSATRGLEIEMRIEQETLTEDWSSNEVLQPWIRLAATLRAHGYEEGRLSTLIYNKTFDSELDEYGISYDDHNDEVNEVLEALRGVGIPANDWEPWG